MTVVSLSEAMPWRYPALCALQFGEWLRQDLLAGVFEPPALDIDLAILLTKARQQSLALAGPAADRLFEPVPKEDFYSALADTLRQWNAPADWAGAERNVVLALARIWYSASTGRIAPKDAAAAWLLDRLPPSISRYCMRLGTPTSVACRIIWLLVQRRRRRLYASPEPRSPLCRPFPKQIIASERNEPPSSSCKKPSLACFG